MLKIIITTAIIFIPGLAGENIETQIQEKPTINCEYLFFSGQGSPIQNKICEDEFERINTETIKWKREALEARGIY